MESLLSTLGNDLISQQVAKQGLWAILYILLFVYTLRESRLHQENAKERENNLRQEYHLLQEESRDRENKLTEFINNISKQFENLATQYEKIAEDIQRIKVNLSNKENNS